MGSFINRLRLRANMVQEDLVAYTIPLSEWRKTGNLLALPTAGDGTNLGVNAGSHGSGGVALNSSDFRQAAVTEKARIVRQLPAEYVGGQSITLRLHAKINTAAQVSASIDVECFKGDKETGVGSDLCSTAAQNLTTSWADYDFTITPTGLVAGDELDIEITAALDDTGGAGSNRTFFLGDTRLLLDIKG